MTNISKCISCLKASALAFEHVPLSLSQILFATEKYFIENACLSVTGLTDQWSMHFVKYSKIKG